MDDSPNDILASLGNSDCFQGFECRTELRQCLLSVQGETDLIGDVRDQEEDDEEEEDLA